MATSNEYVDSTRKEPESGDDDICLSSDFRQVCSYSSIKETVGEVLESIETFVSKENFKKHIRPDVYNIEEIEGSLELRRKDLAKTDCSVIVAGETSSGKSSIINRILGDTILPTGVTASTTRVCRVKYSEDLMITTCDAEDKNEIDRMYFQSKEDMAETLNTLAKTKDPNIGYIDIHMPVPLLQGNVIIVDTPGFGDNEQKKVAEKMIEYIPNALAIVFVINVAAAGGIQDDRIVPILTHVQNLRNQMVSFSPNDVIFVMNRWDSLCMETELKKKEYTENTKKSLQTVWRDVDDDCILQLSMVPTDEYREMFQRFQRTLKKIITHNEQKRIKVHLRFLKEFLDESERIIVSKLKCAEETVEENKNGCVKMLNELEDLERIRQEAHSNLKGYIDDFLREVTSQFYEYIHQRSFKNAILKCVESSTRRSIGKDLDDAIEKATIDWQQHHIEEIFQKVIGEELTRVFSSIQKKICFLKEKMKGFKTKTMLDVDFKIACALAPSGTLLVSSIVMSRMLVDPRIVAGCAVLGLVVTGLAMMEVIDDFKTICEKTLKSRIDALSKEKIYTALQQRYASLIESIITKLLDGDVKNEINNMKRNVHSLQEKHKELKSATTDLKSLRDELNQRKAHLNKIEKIEINLD
uniref:Dynamin N-terminal domain-containing protein n=1 Tax=Magallana gigas TaxID=29159 RepID=A0A8W8JS18_MAGGI|nr:uncharacterized protein in xynA 3'region-like [Crassostrea gigas]